MKQINDLLHSRGVVVDKMTALLDNAESEGRDLNVDEQATYEKMEAEQSDIKNRVDRLTRQQEIENSLQKPTDSAVKPAIESKTNISPFASAEYKAGINAYLRKGKSALDQPILNALQIGTDSEGGYVVPEEFDTAIVEALQDWNEIRQYCTVISTGSDRNIPIESTLGVATWTAEEAAYTESDAAFGRVILGAHKAARIIKVSEELLQDSFFDLEGYLARNFGKSFGLLEEAAFVNGSGSGQPTGITDGASAGPTFAGAAAITGDEMIDVYHALSRPYRMNATWIMADATVKLIRKLKDSDGQYIWQPKTWHF